jgi:hypothetical protein
MKYGTANAKFWATASLLAPWIALPKSISASGLSLQPSEFVDRRANAHNFQEDTISILTAFCFRMFLELRLPHS